MFWLIAWPLFVTALVAYYAALLRAETTLIWELRRAPMSANDLAQKTGLGQWLLYPALRDLECNGFVTSFDGESTPERGGRPRRYYRMEVG